MTWFRAHRRTICRLAALVLALQSLALVVSAAAHAAAAGAEGSNLVVVCTSEGLKVIDLTAPDREPVSLGSHQCPLCLTACAGNATAVPPVVFAVVAITFEPADAPDLVPAPVETPLHLPRLALKSAHPRGPPVLA